MVDMDDQGSPVDLSQLNVFSREEGRVAVARLASPELSTIVGKCAAIICETGGTLSHLAITMREFGQCGVFGVKSATQIIKHGDHLLVDGELVTIIEEI